jgi:DNA-binding NarL/FixJ family response regulator
MDVSMTSMNGFEAARRIKSNPSAPTVVLTTFHDSEAARNEAWAAGADLLIAKADVTSRVREVIKDLAAGRVPGEIDNKARSSKNRTDSTRPSTKRVPKEDLTQ